MDGVIENSGGAAWRRFRHVRMGATTVAGFGASMLVLAVVSLLAIPAMIAASGPIAWGMIALGQSIGGIGSAVVTYGWGLSGPAAIARADDRGRKAEYLESLKVRVLLWGPTALVAFLLALSIAGEEYGQFAGFGAISMTTVGLSASWVFIGARQPIRLLVLETIPRVAGTIVGISMMAAGSDALTGVAWQFIGMLAAFAISSIGILEPLNFRALRVIRPRAMRTIVRSQRSGVFSGVLSSLYIALPIVIVSLVAPSAQPAYAVVEKVQRQVIVGLGPFVTVMQGWVPRASGQALVRRVRHAILIGVAFASVLTIFMFVVAPELVDWLGNSEIDAGLIVLLFMAVITGTSLLEAITARACLVALDRLDAVSKATAIGFVIGLPVVAAGSALWEAAGALAGVLVGLGLRLSIELVFVYRATLIPGESRGTARSAIE